MRLRMLIGFAVLMLMGTTAQAQCPNVPLQATTSFAHETLTVSNSAVSLTSSTYAPTPTASGTGAVMAMFTVENDSLRFWTDGGTPTSSQGFLAVVGSAIYLCSPNEIRGFKAIRSASTDVPIQVEYFRVQ